MEEDLPFPSLLDCSSILISFYNSQKIYKTINRNLFVAINVSSNTTLKELISVNIVLFMLYNLKAMILEKRRE